MLAETFSDKTAPYVNLAIAFDNAVRAFGAVGAGRVLGLRTPDHRRELFVTHLPDKPLYWSVPKAQTYNTLRVAPMHLAREQGSVIVELTLTKNPPALTIEVSGPNESAMEPFAAIGNRVLALIDENPA